MITLYQWMLTKPDSSQHTCNYRDLSRIFRQGPMAYGIEKNSVILVIIAKVFQATEFMHLCCYVLFMFSINFYIHKIL